MANFTPPFDTTAFLPSKSDLTKWIYDIWVYLRDNPIVSEENVSAIINDYLEQHPIDAPVKSVNGKTGNVTGLYDAENPPPYPVTSVNGKTDAVTGLYDAENPPPYPVTSVNRKTGAVTGLYDAENPPPYPVTSVNGKTGAVSGLYSTENPPPYPVTSVNGKTGAVSGLYSTENPPPYPVTSVNGLTGAIVYSPVILITASKIDDHTEYTIPPNTVAICSNVFIDSGSLPAGNTMYTTITWDNISYLNEGFVFIPKAQLMLDGYYSTETHKCKMIITNRTNMTAPISYGLNMMVCNYSQNVVHVKFYNYDF